jgi:hypothetical protein
MISHIVAFEDFVDDDMSPDEHFLSQPVFREVFRDDHFQKLPRTVDLYMIFLLSSYHAHNLSRPDEIDLVHSTGFAFTKSKDMP